MREKLYNQRFDDIYFSEQDGLSESQHVFLTGNDLPEKWAGKRSFTIAETGFGTGLNFLATWLLFDQTSNKDQTLHYISFEQYPLSVQQIEQALNEWKEPLGTRLQALIDGYPIRNKGFHRISFDGGKVQLTLIFDDVNESLSDLNVPRGVDAWYLDGFAPSKNPQMWTELVYKNMARLSQKGSSFSTFTAAGHVRRGLEAAGFKVEKKEGFGRKREMSTGIFDKDTQISAAHNDEKHIAIIGGGLAGAACSYVLSRNGIKTTLFEKADMLASGASGNKRALYNARFSAKRSAEADFYMASYAMAIRHLELLSNEHEIFYEKCGTLHLINSDEKEKRFKSMLDDWGWHEAHLKRLSADEASQIAGIRIDKEALYLADAGFVSPSALCKAYTKDSDLRLGSDIQDLKKLEQGWQIGDEVFSDVILACGSAVKDFAYLSWLPIHTVRGQISYLEANKSTAALKCNICYGGYISAAFEGEHVIGSTFQKWRDDVLTCEQDDKENLDKLYDNLPFIKNDQITGARASLRTASKDHFPLAGRACDEDMKDIEGLYISSAHGSHGAVSTIMSAQIISDMILDMPYSLPQRTVHALEPKRFLKRALKKQNK